MPRYWGSWGDRLEAGSAPRSELAFLEILDCLDQLLAGVHDEWTIAGHRLTQWPAGHEDGAAVFFTAQADFHTRTENGHAAGIDHGRTSPYGSFKHIHERRMLLRQCMYVLRSRTQSDIQIRRIRRRLGNRSLDRSHLTRNDLHTDTR